MQLCVNLVKDEVVFRSAKLEEAHVSIYKILIRLVEVSKHEKVYNLVWNYVTRNEKRSLEVSHTRNKEREKTRLKVKKIKESIYHQQSCLHS